MNIFRISLVLTLFLLSSCSVQNNLFTKTRSDFADNIPWVSWNFGEDINGNKLVNSHLNKGDEAFKNREYKIAGNEYYLIKDSPFVPEETVVLRLASSELLDDSANEALNTLSAYYRKKGFGVNQVRIEGGLLFSYIYGSLNNPAQSLAWSARALAASREEVESTAAQDSIRVLLKHLPNAQLRQFRSRWINNSEVDLLFRDEEKARVGGADALVSLSDKRDYWNQVQENNDPADLDVLNAQPTNRGIAVLLPLTGRYNAFGNRVKHGVELALTDSKSVFYTFEDTGGNPTQAAEICERIAATKKYSFILGPLLYAPSEAVAHCAKRHNIKLISFTKKPLRNSGPGIFQLGMTANTQVQSLLKGLSEQLGARKIALIRTQDDPTARTYQEAYYRHAKNYSLETVFSFSLDASSGETYSQLNEMIHRYRPDVLLVVDPLQTGVRVSANLDARLKPNLRIAGLAEWANIELLTQNSRAIDRPIMVTPFLSNYNDLAQRFTKTYVSVYEKAPDFLAAQSYDAAILTEAIINRLNSGVTWQELISNFQSYQGLTGDITFTNSGELIRLLRVVEYNGTNLVRLQRGVAGQFVYKGNNEQDTQR